MLTTKGQKCQSPKVQQAPEVPHEAIQEIPGAQICSGMRRYDDRTQQMTTDKYMHFWMIRLVHRHAQRMSSLKIFHFMVGRRNTTHNLFSLLVTFLTSLIELAGFLKKLFL